jgi:GH43 family beta-xylosidase
LSRNHARPSLEQLKKHAYCNWHNSYSHATNDCNVFHRQVQSTINEGRLKFVESPQMKLDKDSFPRNMNMVELNGKKVLVWPSQADSTKGKEVIIGEERPPRMIKKKSLKDGQL